MLRRNTTLVLAVAVAAFGLAALGFAMIKSGKAQATSEEQDTTPVVAVSGESDGRSYSVRIFRRVISGDASDAGRYLCIEFKSPPGGEDDFNCFEESSFVMSGGVGVPFLGAYFGVSPSKTARVEISDDVTSQAAELFGPYPEQSLDLKLFVAFDPTNPGGENIAATRLVALDEAGGVIWQERYEPFN